MHVYMNQPPPASRTDGLPSGGLVEIIELKWLLAGQGIHIHVERLQSDPEYARHMLDRAAAVPNDVLRQVVARVRRSLGLSL